MRRYGSSPQLILGTLTLLLLTAATAPVEAQSIRDRLKAKATQRVDERVDQAIDRTLDAVECVITDPECIESAQASGKDVVVTDTDGNPISKSEGKPGEGEWLNYDYTPGDRVLFYTDFSDDEVGDFPRGFDLVTGNFEVMERGGVRFLRASSDGEIHINLPEVLPEQFTLEFDVIGPQNNHQYVRLSKDNNAAAASFRANPNGGEGGIEGGGVNSISPAPDAKPGAVFPFRLMADGKHVKMYLGGTRVANVPNADMGRMDKIRLLINTGYQNTVYIGNVRVAAGGKDLYDALAESGRVATQGILFDVGSDRIRPESTPTLKEIGAMLKKHGSLKLVIEGHTDSAGDDAANQNLSERRAAAVMAHLVEKYGIDADRLEAKGMGESTPVAPNETPEGRQQNRRVELVKK
ncbi:MAG TPA: OmpA family protein [Longimicrobiales bacterium]|nr:OmpA family protein [Longimicrobiales bacterium]